MHSFCTSLIWFVGAPWEGTGHVLWIEEGEIALEMRSTQVPLSIADGYVAEFVWKSTSYDRYDFIFYMSSTDII